MPISQILLATGTGSGVDNSTFLSWSVEWFQKSNSTQPSSYPRVFGISTYPEQSIGFSLEGVYYGWVNGQSISTGINIVANTWQHWAMVSNGSVLSIYLNGTRVATQNRTTSGRVANSTDDLYIGIDSGANNGFKGLITNFRVVKEQAMYDPTFSTITVPTSPLSSNSNTELLLTAADSGSLITDSSDRNRTPWSSANIAWNADTPFTALGPYTQYTGQASTDGGGTNYIVFGGGNYNADILNVKSGWTVSDGTISGVVIGDAFVFGGEILVPVNFNAVGVHTWTFTQFALGGSIETYTSGYGFIGYDAGDQWALDVPRI
jgi:hypothetical protein